MHHRLAPRAVIALIAALAVGSTFAAEGGAGFRKEDVIVLIREFRTADKDGNGALSHAELTARFAWPAPPEASGGPADRHHVAPSHGIEKWDLFHLIRDFLAIDGDRDGLLSHREMVTYFHHPHGDPGHHGKGPGHWRSGHHGKGPGHWRPGHHGKGPGHWRAGKFGKHWRHRKFGPGSDGPWAKKHRKSWRNHQRRHWRDHQRQGGCEPGRCEAAPKARSDAGDCCQAPPSAKAAGACPESGDCKKGGRAPHKVTVAEQTTLCPR